jgi:hypothetical protein
MAKEIMTRKATDNSYLHKDFHGAMNICIEYLHRTFGPQAVREYLGNFASTFYSPLAQAICERGLIVLKEYFEKIYGLEGANINITLSEDELRLTIPECPAVIHIQKQGLPVDPLFFETTKTVNETICRGTEFSFELVEYDPTTGKSIQRFFRRNKK